MRPDKAACWALGQVLGIFPQVARFFGDGAKTFLTFVCQFRGWRNRLGKGSVLRYDHVATHVWERVQNSTNFKDTVIVDGPSGAILAAVSGGGAIMTYKLSGADSAAVGVSYRPAVDDLLHSSRTRTCW